MAKKQITINDGSDSRKQVELNLNPVALQPTIRSGGNYRVAVQQTPKTNSALQLADALRQGVGLYGQAVNIAQDKAREDVASMSEEDFDKFLTEGLDKESRSIFGYTKAYNQALAKKYYAEEMPTKLQAIAEELHKDPYKYKDLTQFEGAAIAAVNEAYDEADELLGGNVFSEQANNALKSATKADFVEKQNAVFIQKLPEITRQNASDDAFNAFSNITVATNAKKTIDEQMDIVAGLVGNRKEAAAIVTKAYLDNIEALAKQEGQEGLAQELLDELDSGAAEEKAGLQGKRQFGLDKVELFNTSANRLRIEQLEDSIENAGVSGYNAKLARAKTAQATLENKAFDMITGKDGSEAKGFEYLESLLEEMRTNKSITLNGVTYTDEIEIQEIRNFILGAQANPKLFKHTAMSNFIATNGQAEAYAIGQLRNPDTLKTINKEAYDLLVDEALWKAGRPAFTPEGVAFNSAFTAKQEELEQALFKSIANLPEGEKQAQFSALYPERVTAPMQAWVTDELERIVPPEPEEPVQEIVSKEEIARLNEKFGKEDADAIVAERIELHNREQAEYVFTSDKDGGRRLTGEINDNVGGAIPSASRSYKLAIERDLFVDEQEQIKGFDFVYKRSRTTQAYGPSTRGLIGTIYHKKPLLRFSEYSLEERAEKKLRMRESLSFYGISAQELLEDKYSTHDFTISELYGSNGVDFGAFPLVINGSLQGIINEIEAYDKDPDNYKNNLIVNIANKHNISVPNLLEAQRRFLTEKNFIR